MPELADGLIYYLVFLFSTTLHEAAHAWMALRGGDPTAYKGGQMTLDPLPHIRREPVGMVALPVLSVILSGWPFGFASAPYDPQWARRYPRRAAWMALAGPTSNFSLVVSSIVVIRLGSLFGLFAAPESVTFDLVVTTDLNGPWPAITFLVSVFFSLNLLLGVFNLIPVPPLDGSGVVPLFLSEQATRSYQQFLWGQPMFAMMGILIAWRVMDYVFHPIWLMAVNLIHAGVTYG
ncbi:MAG: site-2 protease family protein [Acidobacteriota bacterium]